MVSFLISASPATLAVQGAGASLTLWIGLGVCAIGIAGVVLLYTIHARLVELEKRTGPLGRLESIDAQLTELVKDPQDLDLRRLEHVLIDIRDGQKRVEARTLAVLESLQNARADAPQAGPTPAASGGVDRIMSRLLALGFERIELLTPSDEVAEMFESDGDVLVEARRSGVPYKGRVVLQAGTIADVQLRPSYQIFP